jgi:hypothetical protein
LKKKKKKQNLLKTFNPLYHGTSIFSLSKLGINRRVAY